MTVDLAPAPAAPATPPPTATLLGAAPYLDGVYFADGPLVELVRHDLSDEAVVTAARVSTGRDLLLSHGRAAPDPAGGGRWLSYADRRLIAYLMRNKHGSPFEHGYITFLVVAPIFVAREWMRHRAGHSYNEQSARYTTLDPVFYLPDVGNLRERVGKPGHYQYRPVSDLGRVQDARTELAEAYRAAWRSYELLLAQGIAPEQARAVLPVATYTRFYWTANPRSLMHWLSLRHAPTAQQEIRAAADQVWSVFRKVMPVTAGAFATFGRVAP